MKRMTWIAAFAALCSAMLFTASDALAHPGLQSVVFDEDDCGDDNCRASLEEDCEGDEPLLAKLDEDDCNDAERAVSDECDEGDCGDSSRAVSDECEEGDCDESSRSHLDEDDSDSQRTTFEDDCEGDDA